MYCFYMKPVSMPLYTIYLIDSDKEVASKLTWRTVVAKGYDDVTKYNSVRNGTMPYSLYVLSYN